MPSRSTATGIEMETRNLETFRKRRRADFEKQAQVLEENLDW
jgi:hypothetical protein